MPGKPVWGELETMKKAFVTQMREMTGGQPRPAQQVRDMVRIFAKGWMDSMIAHGQEFNVPQQTIIDFAIEVNKLMSPTWGPDGSWSWWGPNISKIIH